jgi:xanthine dehydrogenase accessory factor
MGEAAFWEFIAAQLQAGRPCALLLVGAHVGSSPGRQGFKMAVTADEMAGSVGGGIMEHKFVELVRARLAAGESFTELRRQVHSKAAPQDQSGMICSGEQTLLLHRLAPGELAAVEQFALAARDRQVYQGRVLRLDGFGLSAWGADVEAKGLVREVDGLPWHYSERIGGRPTAFVVGGGHVGLAMCKLLSDLDFHVVNLDERSDLYTMRQNQWAAECLVVPYDEIDRYIPEGPDSYVIVMSFGYRTDEAVMRRLLGKRFAYLGMMGSRAKVDQLWAALLADGFSAADINAVSAPAGFAIGSQTPAEIAVSIAAELIQRRHSR